MSIKAGLRALAVTVGVIGGMAGAEAATYTYSVSSGWNQTFNISGPIDDPVNVSIGVSVSANTLDPQLGFSNREIHASVYPSSGFGFGLYVIDSFCSFSSCNAPDQPFGSFILTDAMRSFRVETILNGFNVSNLRGFVSFTLPDNLSVVPIPAAAPMLASALGLGGFVGWRRKRKQRQAMAVAAA